MALRTRQKTEWKPIGSRVSYFSPKDLYTKKLSVDFNSLQSIARRPILSLERRQSYHPNIINYHYFINITILNDKLFRHLNSDFLFNKKRNIDVGA